MKVRKQRVIVAGQTPPPVGGQNVMIEGILRTLGAEGDFEVQHLAFHFARGWSGHRQPRMEKTVEVVRVIWRLVTLRARGSIDVLVYPFGGPHLVPLLRDFALIPFCLLLARHVTLHIHAGGMAEAIPKLPRVIQNIARNVYSRCQSAIVLTHFSVIDAECLRIPQIHVAPNVIPDSYSSTAVCRGSDQVIQMLYVGHLCEMKGTPQLLHAFSAVHRDFPITRLALLGETLPPFSPGELKDLITKLGIEDRVSIEGVRLGEDKWKWFARADMFIFPSIAPESLPLVLLEAMMWALPIVATDWRSHSEILGDSIGGYCFQPEDNLAARLEKTLLMALRNRSHWPEWGMNNRRRFLEFYEEKNSKLPSIIRKIDSSL